MCRQDSDVSLPHSFKDKSHYVKKMVAIFVKWPPKWRINWHDVFGNTFSGIYAPQNLYIQSKLKVLRLLVSEIAAILENGRHNRPRHNLAWHYS